MGRSVIKRTVFLSLPLIFLCSACDGNSGGTSPALLAVLSNPPMISNHCKSLPKDISVYDYNTLGLNKIIHCSTSGLDYRCQAEGSDFVNVRTYISVARADLGVVDPPDGSNFMLVGERGLGRFKVYDSFDESFVDRHYTFEYDSSLRLVSTTNQVNSTTALYSGYDGNGFPGTRDPASSFDFLYAFDTSIPSQISVADYEISYDSKGWATSWSDASGGESYEISGTVEICE